MKKIFSILLPIVAMTCLLAACGTETLPVADTVKVEFSGMNGYGVANIVDAYDWEDVLVFNKDDSGSGMMEAYAAIEDAIDYELSKDEGLSNGDEVTLSIKVNSEVLEKYGYKAKEHTMKFVVDGLEAPKQYDAFEHMKITVSGEAPYATLNIQTTSDFIDGLTYKASKTECLKNGDAITIDLATDNDENLTAYCAKNGYVLKRSSMEYIVSGVTQYITSLEEVPEEWWTKMQQQAEDTITTQFQKSVNGRDIDDDYTDVKKLVSKECVGHYVFTLKEGYEPSDGWDRTYANHMVVLYKITATSNEGNFDYYYAVRYGDGKFVEGDKFYMDLTNYQKTEDAFNHGTYSWRDGSWTYDQEYHGYKDMDVVYSKVVAPLVEMYTYETDVE